MCGGEAPVDLWKTLGELRDLPQSGVPVWTEHPGQVQGTLAIDREAEEMDALQPRFRHSLVGILDPIGTLIGILIVWPAIRQQEK